MTDDYQAGSSSGGADCETRGVIGAAADAAKQVAGDAKDQIAGLGDTAKAQAEAALTDHKGDVAEALDSVAQALHKTGDQLDGQHDWLAKLVDQGAGELGGLAETLRTNDLQGLLGKLGDLSRRQPAVFVGAAMAAGFAAMRIGKLAVAGASEADLPTLPGAAHEPS